MNQNFADPYEISGENVKTVLDLSNYFTRADLKGKTDIDKSTQASKADLANMKSDLDELDVDKTKTLSADLSQLNNVLDNDIVYEKIDYQVNSIDNKLSSTSGLLTKIQYNLDKEGLEKMTKNVDKNNTHY